MTDKYNPCENCICFPICKQRVLNEANMTDFLIETTREEMIKIVLFKALSDHCSIIKEIAYVPIEEKDLDDPMFPYPIYKAERLSHIAKTFGETI